MRIAIATDQDFVSSEFDCCPACTIVDVKDGKICETFIIPNPGCRHAYWAELFSRNSIRHLIVGNIGPSAQSVLKWWGIIVLSGIEGRIDDVARRFAQGELLPAPESGQAACDPSAAAVCSGS